MTLVVQNIYVVRTCFAAVAEEVVGAGQGHGKETGNGKEARSARAATARAAGNASTVSAAGTETVTMMTATVNESAVRGNAVTETVSASTPPAVLDVAATKWHLVQEIVCPLQCMGESWSHAGN